MKKQQKVYILGGGHFGQRALKTLQDRFQPHHLTLVDIQPAAIKDAETSGGHAVCMDAISFLFSNPGEIAPDSWIVPAVPIHVAYEWMREKMKTDVVAALPVPEDLLPLVPNPMRGSAGQIYTSIATFVCPDNCPEPKNYCTVTGKARPQILWETLSGLALPQFRSVCLVSSQLAPGVGGYQLKQLTAAYRQVVRKPGGILFSTACKCHGVLHAFRWHPKGAVNSVSTR